MKICFICHYSEMLGANQSLIILLEYLSDREDVSIQVVLPAAGAIEVDLKNLNIEYVIIPFSFSYRSNKLNWKGKLLSLGVLLKDYIRLAKYSKSLKKFDIIYSNSSVISHGLFLSRILNTKHIWHVREYGLEDYSIVPTYGKNIQQFLSRKSDRLIFISNHLKIAKQNWFTNSDSAPVIYNGVKLLDSNINLDLKTYDITQLSICFAGLMSEKKNAIEGLDLLEYLKNENVNATYFIYATMNGVYAEKFMDEVNTRNLNENVKIMGFVKNLSDSIKDHHFLIMPSRNEAMGRVSIEAMSVGVPVVGYEAGGTAELFEDGVSGIYYKDISEVKDRIKLMTKSTYKTMSKNAYDTVQNRFSSEVYGKRIYTLCKELIEDK